MQLDTQLDMHFRQHQWTYWKTFFVKSSEIINFPKQLPVTGIQVLGLGHPVHPSKPPGQNTSSSPQGIGHKLGHVTPSIPGGAIFQ